MTISTLSSATTASRRCAGSQASCCNPAVLIPRSCAGGYATIGTIGFEGRLDYGAIGTVTNLAARLCGDAKENQVLISPRIFSKVEAHIEADPIGELSLKGFQRPVFTHNVVGLRAPA
jgi:class 3 adenylate cyclase